MAGMFSSPKPPPPPVVVPPPPPPATPTATPTVEAPIQREDPAIQAKREEAEAEIRRRTGRASTILSGALGDTSMAPIGRKVLMGG